MRTAKLLNFMPQHFGTSFLGPVLENISRHTCFLYYFKAPLYSAAPLTTLYNCLVCITLHYNSYFWSVLDVLFSVAQM